MSEVKMFKLVSGEMCIGTIKDEQPAPDIIVVNIPMLIHYAAQPTGQLGIKFFPLNPFTDKSNEDIPLNKQHIMFFVDKVVEEIRDEYIKITTGITVAKNMPTQKIPKLELR